MQTSRCAKAGIMSGGLVTAIGLLALAVPARAQSRPAYRLWTIDSLKSEILGDTRKIFIAPPSDYDRAARASERFPVLIILDALDDDYLAAQVASARVLAAPTTPAIPPLIVVGVETLARYRDFAPPTRDDGTTTGGSAPNFARFLETELLPMIRARYRTLPFTIIAGHSLSGLFVAYAYGQSPQFVNAVIALSPSLIWERGYGVQLVADGIRARSAPGRVFVGTGSSEFDLDSAATRLATELRARPGRSTTFMHRTLVGDTHYTSPLQGLIDGLRFIFQPVQLTDRARPLKDKASPVVGLGGDVLLPSAEEELAAYRDTQAKYALGARELGLPEALPAFFGGGLGLWLASSDRVSAAISICQDIIASHPDNWVGYDCLGNAQGALQDSSGSVASYRKAIELAERAGDTAILVRLRRGLDRFTPKTTQK